jgi:hypothetical protein
VSGPILHLSILQSPVFLLNSRLGLFSAATIADGVPFPEVTGSILPSSLTVNHSSALVYSPDYVCPFTVRVLYKLSLADFLGSLFTSLLLRAEALRILSGSTLRADLPTSTSYTLQRTIPSAARTFTSPSPHRSIK